MFPELKNNSLLFAGMLLVCFFVSVGFRFQQFEDWKKSPNVFFVGDGVLGCESLIRNRLGEDAHIANPVSPPLAGVVGKLAFGMFTEGLVSPPDSIRPLYVRRPDAEVSQERRKKPRKKL